mgnify:CR=1 FL=1
MKKIFLISLLVLFITTCFGVTGYLYFRSVKPKETFATDSVYVMDIYKKTVATGSIEPRKEVSIRPQISGIIEQIYVKAGMKVKKGDLIARVKIIPEMMRLNEAETSLNTAQINFELAEKELDRQKKLFEDKVISQMEYIKYEQDYKLRKEQLESAENSLQLIKKGVSKRIKTSTTEIKATIDGTILDIPIKEGSVVIQSNSFNEGTTVTSIANMNDMIFKGKVVESEVSKLEEGMDLNLQIGAFNNEVYKAKLEFISSKGVDDKGAIQFEIRAGINQNQNSKHKLRAGYSASADIILDKRASVLAIKEKNVEMKNDSAFVYVETQPQVFVKRLIKTGLSDDVNVEVISGLGKNEKIKVLAIQ